MRIIPTDAETVPHRERRAKNGLTLAILSVGAWLLAGFPCTDVACPSKIEIGLMAFFVFGGMMFILNSEIGSSTTTDD